MREIVRDDAMLFSLVYLFGLHFSSSYSYSSQTNFLSISFPYANKYVEEKSRKVFLFFLSY